MSRAVEIERQKLLARCEDGMVDGMDSIRINVEVCVAEQEVQARVRGKSPLDYVS